MDEIPFIVTGGKDAASPGRRRGERKGKRGGRHPRNKAMDTGVTRSRMETSFCSVCQAKNQGLVAMCLRCGHGGHMKHIREWFSDDVNNRRRKCAIVTCQCHCVFVEENGNSVQWRVCFRRACHYFGMQKQKVLSLYGYFLCILVVYMTYLQFFSIPLPTFFCNRVENGQSTSAISSASGRSADAWLRNRMQVSVIEVRTGQQFDQWRCDFRLHESVRAYGG